MIYDKVNILGTEYALKTLSYKQSDYMKNNGLAGYCDYINHLIVVSDFNEGFDYKTDKEREEAYKLTMRHEVIHAYLNESGLQDSSLQYSNGWARNEEMVDWIAIQLPKIVKTLKELEVL